MKMSTKSRYTVRALLDLAANFNGEPIQIKKIAKRQDISMRYLENLFTLLRAAGILTSEKGRGGGFSLAKDPTEINLLDVVEIVEGELSLVYCVNSPASCERSQKCITRGVWVKVSENLKSTLASITLQDLIENYKNGIEKEDKIIYYI